jgi:uncharacterized membrane protein
MAGSVTLTSRGAVLAIALGLAACQPQAPDGKPAPPPADAPRAAEASAASRVSDFSQPMTAHGNEPFWSLTIDGTHLKLTRPDHPELAFEAPGAAIQPGRAIWVAKAADGQQVTATFYVSECSDGMSDLKYPMTAEVILLNETLRGCASKTAERPREGG